MHELEVPSGIALRFPADLCCNCGTTVGVAPVDLPLVLTRFFGGGGVEYRLTAAGKKPLRAGHCSACAPTAARLRRGLMGHLVAWAGTSVLAGIVVAMAIGGLGAWEQLEHAFWAGPALAAATLLAWGLLRRPPGQARTYHQAVWVLGLQQRFSGQILGWRLGFANDEYAARVLAENPGLTPPG